MMVSKMIFLFQGCILRFQPFIFRGAGMNWNLILASYVSDPFSVKLHAKERPFEPTKMQQSCVSEIGEMIKVLMATRNPAKKTPGMQKKT